MTIPRMPFGKHRGQLLTVIPDGYLRWLLRECDSMDLALRQAVIAELSRRGIETPGPTPEAGSVVGWQSIFRTWFAGLARDYHPDRIGGDGREMKAINEAAERLRKLLEVA